MYQTTSISPRRISFKHCLQIWLIYLQNAQYLDDEYIGYLFRMMVQKKVGNRPGRIEPRAVKRRPKAYPLLTRTRHEARAEVMKNGHPKKLK
jgi:hypothetical protein